jgi:DHA2 family multidrug resistance protein-like MFS transporter
LIFALKHIAMRGLDAAAAGAVILGLSAGAAFIRRQRHLRSPLIDLSLFRRTAVSASLAANALGFALIAGTGLLVGQDLQLVHGLTPLQAGLWGIPTFGAFMLGDVAAPVLVRRMSPATVIGIGLGVAAIGFVLLAQAAGGGVGLIVVATVISSMGLAPVFNLAAGQAVEAAPATRAGAASALSETSTELGFALGIALLGTVAGAVYRGGVHVRAARESLGAAIGTGDPAIAGSARHAFVHAVSLTSALSSAVAEGSA